MYVPMPISETLISACRKEQLIWRPEQDYHIYFFRGLLLIFDPNIFPGGGGGFKICREIRV